MGHAHAGNLLMRFSFLLLPTDFRRKSVGKQQAAGWVEGGGAAGAGRASPAVRHLAAGWPKKPACFFFLFPFPATVSARPHSLFWLEPQKRGGLVVVRLPAAAN